MKFTGQLFADLKEPKKAVKFFQQALMDLPPEEHTEVRQQLVSLLVKLEEGDKALQILRQNVSENPNSAQAWYELGQALQDLNEVGC